MEIRDLRENERARPCGCNLDGWVFASETYRELFVIPFTDEEKKAIEKSKKDPVVPAYLIKRALNE